MAKGGRREGRGSLMMGYKGGKDNEGVKSPAWSSQVLGSTAVASLLRFSLSITRLVLTPALTLNDPLRPKSTTAQNNYTGFNSNT